MDLIFFINILSQIVVYFFVVLKEFDIMEKDMTKGNPWKIILLFSLPLLIGNIFQQLYSMVDSIIVGKILGEEALASVGTTGPIVFLVIGFAQGIAAGFSIITSQKYGANDKENVRKSFATSMILCSIITVIITILSLVGTDWLLKTMNVPENIFAQSKLYIMIIFSGFFAAIYYNLFSGVLRAIGDSITPLVTLLVSSLLNILLDILFVGPLKMGVAGAAYATVIAQGLSAIACFIYMYIRYPILRIKKEDVKLDLKFSWSHLRVGLPMALQFSITAVGVIILQSAINNFGSTAIAAFTAASKVEMLVTQPFATLGITMASYCGQNYGANLQDRIKKGIKVATILVLASSVTAAIINIVFGRAFTYLFLDSPSSEMFVYSQQYLVIIALFYPVLGLLYIYRNSLQGLGDSLIPMIGGIGELLARTLVAMLIPATFGYIGLCFASPAAWIAATIPLTIKTIIVCHKKINASSNSDKFHLSLVQNKSN